MSSLGKRSRSITKEVSPPPLRRKRTGGASTPHEPHSSSPFPGTPQTGSAATAPASPPNPHHLRIYSWNVNGITPFLQSQSQFQARTISSYFAPSNRPSTPATTTTAPKSPHESEPYTLRNFLRRHDFPHLLCLQEVKISPADKGMQAALERAANSDTSTRARNDHDRSRQPRSERSGPATSYTAHFSLPRDAHNARGFGGRGRVHGVCTLVRDDVLERYEVSTKDVEWDLEGRVLCTEIVPRPHIDIAGTTTTSPSWQEAKIRRDKEWRDESTEASKRKRDKLVVVNGYWVNGTSAPWRDSSTGAIIGTRHDIKRLFHSRMLALSRSYESAGYHVIHIGDMNIARSAIDGYPGIRLGDQHVKNRADFNLKFFDMPRVEGGFHGVDVWRYVYGERRKYSYHGRGIPWGSSCDRVDLCVVSRSVVLGVEEQAGNDDGPGVGSALVGTDICDNPTDRGHSDHCPLWVAVDMERLGVKCEIG